MNMPAPRPIPRSIREDAARWFALRDGGEMTPEDEAQWAAWLAADPLHRAAFAQAEAIWSVLDERAFDPPLPRPRSRTRRWLRGGSGRGQSRWLGGAVAASLALGLVIVTDLPTRIRADAMTATGEQRRIRLPDGSIALLNTGSAIAFDASGRSVQLLQGEAAFQVAADPAHPFSVTADGGSATALGTRFLVRRMDDGVRVTVTEHSVRVDKGLRSAVVREGEALVYDADGPGAVRPIAIPDADAWTRGRIRIVNRPLGEVVAELARYHSGYIAVSNAALARRPVSGAFDIGNPVGAIDVIQQTLGIGSIRMTDRLIMLHD